MRQVGRQQVRHGPLAGAKPQAAEEAGQIPRRLTASLPSSMRRSRSSRLSVFDGTPLAGTSSFDTQATAFNSSVRKLSSARLVCLCRPVKPKPRPPSGRSYAQAITCFLPADTASQTAGLPPCVDDVLPPPWIVFNGGSAYRIGVT